jgi:hypothetical protein
VVIYDQVSDKAKTETAQIFVDKAFDEKIFSSISVSDLEGANRRSPSTPSLCLASSPGRRGIYLPETM